MYDEWLDQIEALFKKEEQLILEADSDLELKSSAGIISIGNDNVSQYINIVFIVKILDLYIVSNCNRSV